MSAAFERVLKFVAELDRHHATHRLSVARPEAIMVEVAVPGERWEVEFFLSGEVEVERFHSTGHISAEDSLVDLWRLLE